MGRYSAKYFGKTRTIIAKHRPGLVVTMQFFQRANNVVLCGINEVLELLKKKTDVSSYQIKYRPEGSLVNAGDVVLELEGDYTHFGVYEGMIDGILVRQSSLATNARRVVEAAAGKMVIFMGDRADHYANQERDGYAVALGGIKTQVTDAQVAMHDGQAVGTVPHALIQMFGGDLIAALHAYQKTFPHEKLTALVDFHNNVIRESLAALKAFGANLGAIRIDTSANMRDAMFSSHEQEYGVTPKMVKMVRNELDKHNGQHVKIIVSSGFTAERIAAFEAVGAPVDIYGIGGSILQINLNFTCDAVRLNGKPLAKVGRAYRPMIDYQLFKS